MHIVQDIDGTNIARAFANADTCELTIIAASGFTQTANPIYFPAESLSITKLEGIAALRDLCERLIEAHMEAAQRG